MEIYTPYHWTPYMVIERKGKASGAITKRQKLDESITVTHTAYHTGTKQPDLPKGPHAGNSWGGLTVWDDEQGNWVAVEESNG